MVTLDGNEIFGSAVAVVHSPHTSDGHLREFYGDDGAPTFFAGTGGRRFIVTGMLSAPTLPSLNAAEAALLSYNDGASHSLVDARGRIWHNVRFLGDYVPARTGPLPLDGGGWGLPYRMTLHADD